MDIKDEFERVYEQKGSWYVENVLIIHKKDGNNEENIQKIPLLDKDEWVKVKDNLIEVRSS